MSDFGLIIIVGVSGLFATCMVGLCMWGIARACDDIEDYAFRRGKYQDDVG